MKRAFIALFALLLTFFLHLHASWTFVDKSCRELVVDWIEESDLHEEEEVFINAFLEAYKDFSIEQLGIKNKKEFLKSAFEDVREDLATKQAYLVHIKDEGKVVGFAGFKTTEIENQIYISQLAVDPNYWHNGIGKELIYSLFQRFKETRSLVVIPRRVNEPARQFYFKLGFHECAYMHPGYDSKKYVGYELEIAKNLFQ